MHSYRPTTINQQTGAIFMEFYTVENIERIKGDGFYIQIRRNTNNNTGEVIYVGVGLDTDTGNRLPMPICRGTLEQVTKWANENI